LAAHTLLASDIKRFLERPAEMERPILPLDAPPGAPIGGDTGMDWLSQPPGCTWTWANSSNWSTYWPPM
jgi:hypothetical protein